MVAGGSKWTYGATFGIAMKGGREYYTTAAMSSMSVDIGGQVNSKSST